MGKIGDRGAIELSIGTLVIIVLAMTMLILGIVLLKNIFSSAEGVVDMTDDQLREEINKLFGEDKKLIMYPSSRKVEIQQGETDGFGFGLKNLIEGSSGGTFSYEVVVSDPDLRTKCGVSEKEAEAWIVTGRAEDNIELGAGGFTTGKILIKVPEGSALCTLRYRLNVKHEGQNYASDLMDVVIKSS